MMSQIDVVLVPETSLCAQQNADIFEHPSGPVWMNTVPVSGVCFFFFLTKRVTLFIHYV